MSAGASDRLKEKRELETVLASRTFSKSPNLAKLLTYVCTKYWDGEADELKEYRIATEALGKPPGFDPLTNSTVRVELHRLRQKLKQFYENEGLGHEITITLNAGSYVPGFARRAETLLAGEIPSLPAGNREHDWPSHAAAPSQQAGSSATPALRRWKRPGVWAFSLIGAVVLTFFIARASAHRRARQGTPTSPSGLLPAATAAGAPPVQDSVRIIAGYHKQSYVDRTGDVWSGDRYYHGGVVETQFFRRPLTRTLDPALYETDRAGQFSYDIPLKRAPYEVRLYFMETKFGPGTLAGGGEASRIFNVSINGKMALEDFDPYTDAGGNFVADVRAFKDVRPAPDGLLHIKFTSVRDQPFVDAIEALPNVGGKLLPIRIVAQDNTFTDREGRVWELDSYFNGGELAANPVRVQGSPDPGLYNGERYGNFSYALPVAPGKYAVTLRFAETFFGPDNPGHGGVGSRVFDVFCNGSALLRNFDIVKEAGGDNRAVVRTFNGIEPNAQGKILLRFTPVKNYALLNSIQVVDQSP